VKGFACWPARRILLACRLPKSWDKLANLMTLILRCSPQRRSAGFDFQIKAVDPEQEM
jgi:hypothetical protein